LRQMKDNSKKAKKYLIFMDRNAIINQSEIKVSPLRMA